MKPSHPLIDPKQNWIELEFICVYHNKPTKFYSGINKWTGDRMTAFDNDPPTINEEWKSALTTAKDIISKCQMISTKASKRILKKLV